MPAFQKPFILINDYEKERKPGTFCPVACSIVITIKNKSVMDDMIYRNDSIAEENIDPNGRPAENKFEEWSEEVSERTDPGCKDKKVKSAKEWKKLIREMDEVIKEDLK